MSYDWKRMKNGIHDKIWKWLAIWLISFPDPFQTISNHFKSFQMNREKRSRDNILSKGLFTLPLHWMGTDWFACVCNVFWFKLKMTVSLHIGFVDVGRLCFAVRWIECHVMLVQILAQSIDKYVYSLKRMVSTHPNGRSYLFKHISTPRWTITIRNIAYTHRVERHSGSMQTWSTIPSM